jgi:amidase
VVVAKTRVWGRVAHPRDPARTVGGSSSGEAALVAAGASVLGIGSDSGGSIRLPAAWAGVCGLRPTAGRVPTTGHFPRVGPRSDGRTQIGPLAASVDGLELALSVMAGPDGRDAGVAPVPLPPSRGVSLRGLRVAAAFGEGEWQPSDRVAAAVERATGVLVAAGAQRVPWEFGWLAPAWDITHRYWARAGGRADLTGADVMRELEDWDRFAYRYLEATADIDVVVAPATAGPAPPHGDVGGDAFAFLMPASLVGTPALALPAGDEDGLPISVQLVGRPWAEPVLLAAGRAIERAGPG